MKIWVVDDDAFVAELLRRQLAALGFEDVQVFVESPAALTALAPDPSQAALIFLDLKMPCMDGIQFIHELGRLGYTGRLALVSAQEERILQAASRAAVTQGLLKPALIEKPITQARLREFLDSARPSPEPEASQSPDFTSAELQGAVANGEMVVVYQPKVMFVTGALVGVEALVRWQHPRLGLIMPGHFIAALERLGGIDELFWAVLRMALDQRRRWSEHGLDLSVAVNVSMSSLSRLNFPEMLAAEAQAAGVAPGWLTLEITESELPRDGDTTLDILARLRLNGLGLSIDDFGTGHSSMLSLRDVPFDELKLDAGFVHDGARHKSRQAIVQASVAMARSLGMRSVAEGVETLEDWRFARAQGCDVAQGYFVARAMPGDELPRWREDWVQRLSRHELDD